MLKFGAYMTAEDVRALLESAYCQGITLADFTGNPFFSDHFNGVYLPLLENRVPVAPGAAPAQTGVISNPEHDHRATFLIRLRAYMDFFPKDGPEKVNLNRNITLYKALLIKQAACIREGSIEPLNPAGIFDRLQNPPIARRLYCNCIENTRSIRNLLSRFPHRSDFRRCVRFYNLMTLGIHGRYTGRLMEDFIQALERRLACGNDLGRLIAENPGPRLAANGLYDSLEALQRDEARFLNHRVPRFPALKRLETTGELLGHVVGLVSGIIGGSIVDSVKLAIQCHDLLVKLSCGSGEAQGGETDFFIPLRPEMDFFQGSLHPDSTADLDAMENEIRQRVAAIASSLRPGPDIQIRSSIDKGPAVRGTIVHEYRENGPREGAARVIHKRLVHGDPEFIVRIRNSYPGVIGVITEQFRNLKLNRLQVLRMQRKPESFNPAGLVYAVIDDNFARQQRFYDASLRNRRSYAIYHLIDASGSTSAILSPARRSVVDPGREANVLDVEKTAAAAIFTAIEDLDQHESFIQKMFLYQSDMDTLIYQAGEMSCLTRLEADLANRDGAAIRGVSSMLAAEAAETRVLFIFADGMPSDRDYPDGIRDTEMAVKEAADRGVKVFYILTKNTTTMSLTERSQFNRISRFATDRKIVYHPSQLPFKTRDLFTAHLV
ncbi:MAG TPA: hypothetical protein ENN79_13555 [Desulfobacteraceae bacterium]|nr:hypothetical protein [Desulfobacteraceae bacterium]